jgi:type IV secretory pathway VirB4 component
MLRLVKVIKPWKESAALNDHLNLYGFWNETAFLTKGGDLGMVLSISGVDYESLARSEREYAVKRLEASKTGFVSQVGHDATKTKPRDVLVDESSQADIENIGDCLRALGDGQSLGDFSLTIVLYGRSRTELDQLVAEFTGVFTNADGNRFAEIYNQQNAYFPTVPGNMRSTSGSCICSTRTTLSSRFCSRSFPARRRTRISARGTWRCSKPTTARLTSSTCIPATLLIR